MMPDASGAVDVRPICKVVTPVGASDCNWALVSARPDAAAGRASPTAIAVPAVRGATATNPVAPSMMAPVVVTRSTCSSIRGARSSPPPAAKVLDVSDNVPVPTVTLPDTVVAAFVSWNPVPAVNGPREAMLLLAPSVAVAAEPVSNAAAMGAPALWVRVPVTRRSSVPADTAPASDMLPPVATRTVWPAAENGPSEPMAFDAPSSVTGPVALPVSTGAVKTPPA